ncbi:hypothetical protein O5D80_003616 [Batrachochytrium dendrobatidis]|nr:hypothetical protein O5D80_003616 [Batrachochytrium dendrobatidis]
MHQQEQLQEEKDSHNEISWPSSGTDQQQPMFGCMARNGDHTAIQQTKHQHYVQQQIQELESFRKHHQQPLHYPQPRADVISQVPTSSHDHICSHLYHNGYLQGLYADLVVRIQQQGPPGFKLLVDGLIFNLHRIIAIRSPVLATLLHEQEMSGEYQPMASVILNTEDPCITPQGVGIAFGHLYSSNGHALLSPKHGSKPDPDRSILLRAVFASAYLLGLSDLIAMTSDYIKDDISSSSVLGYCQFVSQPNSARYGPAITLLRESIFTFLCKGLIGEISERVGLIWQKKDSEGYKTLVQLFAELPFEWLKRTVESKSFEVASELERFAFAKEIIQLRARSRSPSTPSLIMAGDENVLLSFGGSKISGSGVTIVRKALRHSFSQSLGHIHLTTSETNGAGANGFNHTQQLQPERRVWKASH